MNGVEITALCLHGARRFRVQEHYHASDLFIPVKGNCNAALDTYFIQLCASDFVLEDKLYMVRGAQTFAHESVLINKSQKAFEAENIDIYFSVWSLYIF